ncbi:hypothetical protein [Streptomyces lavendofoliae]|uniref:hypothetical protein n=1 Tax=Streptomyces lavendofoliae TaxID=67314 RepID=UPI00300F4DCB
MRITRSSLAFAAGSARAAMPHDALADESVHVARLYAIHTERGAFRHYAEPMPARRPPGCPS